MINDDVRAFHATPITPDCDGPLIQVDQLLKVPKPDHVPEDVLFGFMMVTCVPPVLQLGLPRPTFLFVTSWRGFHRHPSGSRLLLMMESAQG